MRAKNAPIDFAALKSGIALFLEYADQGYYYAPNRVIPKSKRSKWRFEVKEFLKQLETVKPDDPNAEEAAKLMREIYHRLCYGCGVYIFPSEDPFRSIGIRQPDYYEKMVKRYFGCGFSEKRIVDMLHDAVEVNLDKESLHVELESIFASELPTSDMKQLAMGLAKNRIAELEKERAGFKKYDNRRFRNEDLTNEYSAVVLILGIVLEEGMEAADYCWKHRVEVTSEIKLYCILEVLKIYKEEKLWVNVFEKYSSKVKPRESLQKKYKELKAKITENEKS